MIAGPNGSGKSTLIARLRREWHRSWRVPERRRYRARPDRRLHGRDAGCERDFPGCSRVEVRERRDCRAGTRSAITASRRSCRTYFPHRLSKRDAARQPASTVLLYCSSQLKTPVVNQGRRAAIGWLHGGHPTSRRIESSRDIIAVWPTCRQQSRRRANGGLIFDNTSRVDAQASVGEPLAESAGLAATMA